MRRLTATLVLLASAVAAAESAPAGRRASVTTSLLGAMRVSRIGPQGEVAIEKGTLARLHSGTYVVRYDAPETKGACQVQLTIDAGGTIRQDNAPEIVQARAAHYRNDILPSVLSDLGMTCTPRETLEVRIELWDGVYRQPRFPAMTKIAHAAPEPRYGLAIGDEPAREYRPGRPFEVKAGQAIRFVELPDTDAVASRER